MSIVTTVVNGIGNVDPLGGALKQAADGAVSGFARAGVNWIGSWILSGTEAALREVAGMIGQSTSPQLTSAWFSATYWRVAGLAALLTVPFVFAAALQALMRSEPALLVKVVFAYVPLSLLAVSLLAPVTMLLLRATDAMCALVSAGAIGSGARFLDATAKVAGGLSVAADSPFFAVLVGVMTVAAALMLELELLVRAAAVYVIVMMLPLAFAAFVWPARRIWAIRLLELLVSLILAKFVIVAVLSLAGSAYSLNGGGVSKLMTAMALLLLSTFAPWALLKILPFTEIGAGAAGMLRQELPRAHHDALRVSGKGLALAGGAGDIAAMLPARLHRQAAQTSGGAEAGSGMSTARGGGADAPIDTGTEGQGGQQPPTAGGPPASVSWVEPAPAGVVSPRTQSQPQSDTPAQQSAPQQPAAQPSAPQPSAPQPSASQQSAPHRSAPQPSASQQSAPVMAGAVPETEGPVSQARASEARASATRETLMDPASDASADFIPEPSARSASEAAAGLDAPGGGLPEPQPPSPITEAGPALPGQRVNPFDLMGIGKRVRLDSPSLWEDDDE